MGRTGDPENTHNCDYLKPPILEKQKQNTCCLLKQGPALIRPIAQLPSTMGVEEA